ncbi:MAG TPA: hypothetical protein VFE47_10300 [Tepidisphaeraceae bacterium]|jgi:hypothetical protein|nr:hypothetical protein [Tepidisphaeraceae bacterium]
MASDRLVTHQHILKAVMEYERRGSTKLLTTLETLEPDLTEFLLESLTRLFHELTKLGLSDRDARRMYRRAKKTAVVSIIALRKAQHDLWQNDLVLPEDPPPSP